MRSLLIKGRNSGLLRSSTKGCKVQSQKRWPSLSRALQNLHLMSSFLTLLSKKPFQTPPERKTGPEQHFVSFPQVRRGKQLMRATDIETKSTPNSLPFAQISGHFFLPGLPHGATEMLDGASHHTQRRKTRPNPTSLLRVPVKANFLSRLQGDGWAHVQGNQWKHAWSESRKMCSSSTGLYARYRRSCRKRLHMMKKAWSDPQGPSNKLSNARVLARGAF